MIAISTSRPPHMPPPSDSQAHHLPSSTSTSAGPLTASLPLLPTTALPSAMPVVHRPPPAASRRPKLQLNTADASQTRSFGKGASLRLETLSAVSPTIRNTFSNAYEAPASAAPTLGRPSLKLQTSNDFQVASSPNSYNRPSLPRNDSATASSVSSTDSITTPPPYRLSHSLPSILSNSPYPSIRPRRMAARPFFPATKKVSFKDPLEEEIKNTQYTMKHSDLEASISSRSSDSSAEQTVSSTSTLDDSDKTLSTLSLAISPPPSIRSPSPTLSVRSNESPNKSPKGPGKRDSSDSESEDSCPETPIAGRRKRRRDWRWTLGPVDKNSSSSSASASAETSTSEDEGS